jgi:1-acyl-sn-glycerol-3-phosphate acyltransferase
MITFISKILFRLSGWKAVGSVPEDKKCILIGAPHTSMWDFKHAWLFYRTIGGSAKVLIKAEMFFWPIKGILRWMGALPVERDKGGSMYDKVIRLIAESDKIHLAIAPEGTRSLVKNWKRGFYLIALRAEIPIYITYMDYAKKEVGFKARFVPTGDYKADILKIKSYYEGVVARHPEKFTIE